MNNLSIILIVIELIETIIILRMRYNYFFIMIDVECVETLMSSCFVNHNK